MKHASGYAPPNIKPYGKTQLPSNPTGITVGSFAAYIMYRGIKHKQRTDHGHFNPSPELGPYIKFSRHPADPWYAVPDQTLKLIASILEKSVMAMTIERELSI